ncbi:MAG TPA: chromosome partitioning protein ParB [Planctomycetaceae bacterium]|nr:chromosome partitioning protein ParB [Planctomycetaceae bacterium]HAA51619.1 chromosome partitioning protein ParB [Planctomycetaceae bacterium]HCK51714.1 chromosome partitioning protein ParB [Planctomycetaceae bacterium]
MSSMSSDPASPLPSTRPSRLGRGLAGLVGLTQFGPTDEELVANHVDGTSSEENSVVLEEPVESVQPDHSGDEGPSAGDGDLMEISIDSLVRNPYQPRKDFDAEALQELSASIGQHGVLSPLLVRPIDADHYQLIAGERRWLAARSAGLEMVPCQVRHYTDQQVYETAMEENLKREDLNPLEQAEAFRRYLDEFDSTIDQLAGRLSMSRSAVSNILRLLDLSAPVQQALADRKITAGHARALVTLEEADQLGLCARIVEEGLTVRGTEAAAKAIRTGVLPLEVPVVDPDDPAVQPGSAEKPPELSNHLAQLQDHLRRQFGSKVEIRLTDLQSGRIVIPFANADEFQRVVRVLERRVA